jgi:hypothetical protein
VQGSCACNEDVFINLRVADLHRTKALVSPTLFPYVPGGGITWNPDILAPLGTQYPVSTWVLLQNQVPPPVGTIGDSFVTGIVEAEIPEGPGNYNIFLDVHFLVSSDPIVPGQDQIQLSSGLIARGNNIEFAFSPVVTDETFGTTLTVIPATVGNYRHHCASFQTGFRVDSTLFRDYCLNPCSALIFTILRSNPTPETEYLPPIYLVAVTIRLTRTGECQ